MKHTLSAYNMSGIITTLALHCGLAASPLMAQDQAPQATPGAPNQPVQPAEPDPLGKIHAELLEVQNKLQAAEQKASMQPEVVEKREKFNQMVDETLIDQDPSLETKIEESKELVEKLGKSPELRKPPEEQSDEFTGEMKKFQAIEREISLKRNEVMAKEPAIQSEMEQYQQLMIKEMTKVEPDTPKLLAKRNELVERYRALQNPATGG